MLLAITSTVVRPSTEEIDASKSFDVCRLLSAADIRAELGIDVATGQLHDIGFDEKLAAHSWSCIWFFREQTSGSSDSYQMNDGKRFVILNLMRWSKRDNRAYEYLQGFRRAAETGELPRAPMTRSMGEEALWWGDGLAVRQGLVGFGVSVFPAPNFVAYPGEIEEKLASRILEKLTKHDYTRGQGND